MEKILPKFMFRFLRSKKLLEAEAVLLVILVIFTVVSLFSTNIPVLSASQTPVAVSDQNTIMVEKKLVEDKRVTILRSYLAKKKSPMVENAGDFVEAADAYGVDWKLVPAISGVESSFGQHVPAGREFGSSSYNGWGWGVYGTQSLGFKSWRDGIFTVTEGLKKNYINKGLTNPIAMNRVYAASPTWGVRVAFFIEDISRFEKQYLTAEVASVKMESFETNIAGSSGVLLAQGQ